MKKSFRRSLAMLLVLVALLPVLAMTAMAAPKAPTTVTAYMQGTKNCNYGYFSFMIPGMKGSQRIKSVKSSDTSVAEWSTSRYNADSWKNVNAAGKTTGSGSSRYDYVSGWANKPGTAKLTYEIGSKTYSTKIVAKKYVNPIKSLTVTGINGGINMASMFKVDSEAYGAKLSKTSSSKLTVKAATGWVITGIEVNKSDRSKNCYYYNGVSSATLKIGKITASSTDYANIYITCMNKKDKGYIYLNLSTGEVPEWWN